MRETNAHQRLAHTDRTARRLAVADFWADASELFYNSVSDFFESAANAAFSGQESGLPVLRSPVARIAIGTAQVRPLVSAMPTFRGPLGGPSPSQPTLRGPSTR